MQAQTDRNQPKSGPSPVINIGKPQKFTMPNGLQVMVVENNKLPRVSFNLTLDNAPFAEGNKKGVNDLTSALMGKGSTTTTKDAFNEEIDFLGASINFSSNGAYGAGLSKYAGRILELLAEGSLKPNFTQEELDKEKAKIIEGLKSNEKSIGAVAGRVENVLAFGKNHPNGEYLTELSLNAVTLDDVKQYYNTYFLPGNAYLIIIGDVKFNEVKAKVESVFENWTKGTSPKLVYNDPRNTQYTQINFVDMPNAVQSEISFVNTVNLKMTDPDYFATIVANQIFGGDFNSYLNMNLREKHGWTYGANSGLRGSKYVTKFKANSQVRNSVTDSAVVELLKELKRIRKEKVSDEMLKSVKAGYVGKFVMQIQKPETVARYAIQTETQKLPADFYENYIKNINAVTADQVMKAANKHLLADNGRVMVVGKASEVLAGLEKLKIPIFHFDKFGNPVEKPVVKKADASITPKSIIEKYIAVIGGEKAVKETKTIAANYSGIIQGTPLNLSMLRADKKFKVEMSVMGQTMMKQLVTEKLGYQEIQGQRKNFEGADLISKQEAALTIPEVNLLAKTDLSLLPIEKMNEKEVYPVKSGKTTHYFEVATGLKLAESVMTDAGQAQTRSFGDYKEVNGIKIAHKIILNMMGNDIDFIATDIKVNEGVTDATFE